VGVVLAGCGGGSPTDAVGTTTVQRYDIYPPDTIAVSSRHPDSVPCHRDARALAESASRFVAHWGPASVYPADLAYVVLREELADFETRRCDPVLLGRALDAQLSAKRQAVLLEHAPKPAATFIRKALAITHG
jgi:hypothetical protein